LGQRVAFLLPSLRLKGLADSGVSFEQDIHRFLMDRFDGYTAAAGNLFGYWKDDEGEDSYGEHRQFTVALAADGKLKELKAYLARLAAEMREDCIYLEAGDRVTLIYATPPTDETA
jgi:hypothetical protein